MNPLFDLVSNDIARHAKRDLALVDSLAECTTWLNCIVNERSQTGAVAETTLIQAAICINLLRAKLKELQSDSATSEPK